MTKIVMAVLLFVSICLNVFLFTKKADPIKKNLIGFEKVSNDLNSAFQEPKKVLKKVKPKPKAMVKDDTFKVLDENHKNDEVELSDFPESKTEEPKVQEVKDQKVWISYGVFKTKYFLEENIKKLEDLNIPYKVVPKKNMSNLIIGPFSEKEAKDKIKSLSVPSDAFLIYE